MNNQSYDSLLEKINNEYYHNKSFEGENISFSKIIDFVSVFEEKNKIFFPLSVKDKNSLKSFYDLFLLTKKYQGSPMKLLHILQTDDFDEKRENLYRVATRAIIYIEDKLLMVRSLKDGFYKFPGGGVKKNEDEITALFREIKEEVGVTFTHSDITPYGYVREKSKDSYSEKNYVHSSLYYIIKGSMEYGLQDLDEYEKDLKYKLEVVSLQDSIAANEKYMERPIFESYIIRENYVLKRLLSEKE